MGVSLRSSLLTFPIDTASTAEDPAAGGMHAQGEECSSPGASAGGGGGEGLEGQSPGTAGPGRGSLRRSPLIPTSGDRASVPGSCWGAAGEDADVPGCPRKFFGP